MDNRPIGVFDSGIGGLTAVKELIELLPNEDIVYFGDVGRVPYGTRSRETIARYAAEDIEFLLGKGVKMIVAACGTASSVITDEMIAAIPVPYTGVILPTAKAAISATKNHRVGIIGTTATVRSGSFPRLLSTLSPDIETLGRDCPLFVPLVENGYIEDDNPVTGLVAQEYLASIKEFGADTLILGCTHYPVIAGVIAREMGGGVTLINSGAETARYVRDYLREHNMLCGRSEAGAQSYYISEQTETFNETAEKFIGRRVSAQYVPPQRQ